MFKRIAVFAVLILGYALAGVALSTEQTTAAGSSAAAVEAE